MIKLPIPHFKFLKRGQDNEAAAQSKKESDASAGKILKKAQSQISPASTKTETTKHKLNIFGFLGKKKAEEEESSIEYYKKQLKKQQKKKISAQERRHKLRFYVEKAGLGLNPQYLSKA